MFVRKTSFSKTIIFLAAIGLLIACAAPVLAQVDTGTGLTTRPVKDIINSIINWLLGISAGLAVLFIILGGIYYVTAAGDDSKIETGKKMITYAVLGLFLVGISYAIVKAISDIIGG